MSKDAAPSPLESTFDNQSRVNAKGSDKKVDSSSATSDHASTQPSEQTNSSSTHKPTPKAQKLIDSAYDLSLGISIVVAVLLGLGAGILLQKLSGSVWGLGVGIFWGVGAAVLNIYKAYKRTKKDLEALAHDPKYNYEKPKDSI